MRRDELRRLAEQEAHILAEARQLNEVAEKEQRNLSSAENESFEKMMSDLEETRERRRRGEKLFAEEQAVEKTLATPLEKRIGDNGDAPATYAEYRSLRVGTPIQDQPEYRSAFWRYISSQSLSDLDVEEHRALSKGTTTAGGFLVPTGMADAIIRAQRDFGTIEALANVMVTDSGETINLPANTAHGVASWTGESVGFTPSDETFANVPINAYKSTAKIIVSEELLDDSAFDLDGYLAREMGERHAVLQNTAYVLGDGTNKPQGLLSSATASNITTVTAAVGNTTSFSYDALVTAVFSLPRQYRTNAVFVVNDASARNLYLMKDSTGQPLWATNVAGTGPDTFLGYPIYTDPDLPAPAIGNISVLFGDLNRAYTIRRTNGIGVQRQNELHSDNGQVGFRSFQRVDGRVVLAAAAVAVKHSAT